MYCLHVSLVVLGLLSPLTSRADGDIFAFVDRRGEIHLSNIPDDSRYQSLTPAAAGSGLPREPLLQESIAVPHGRQRFDGVIAHAAGLYKIEAALLHAVISVESGYDPKALSKRGASGLMQLMPLTAKRYGVANAFDPAENVRAGAQYLNDLLKVFDNDLPLALAAYNAGETAVLKYGKRIPPFRETAAYVPKVVGLYEKLRRSM
jgi:soluble lytic murein transglycosylase-like protein